MDNELESFKKIDLVELAKTYGYEIDNRRSTRNAVAMRCSGHKIIAGWEAGHSIYYSVDGPTESGSVVDFIQHRLQQAGQPAGIGHVRRALRRLTSASSFSHRPHSTHFPNHPSGPDKDGRTGAE